MATTRKSAPPAPPAAPADKVEPERVIDAEQERGYRGRKVDPLPNEAYSLETGPDSPTSTGGRIVQHDIANLNQKGA